MINIGHNSFIKDNISDKSNKSDGLISRRELRFLSMFISVERNSHSQSSDISLSALHFV